MSGGSRTATRNGKKENESNMKEKEFGYMKTLLNF